jgi:hypothetical protein
MKRDRLQSLQLITYKAAPHIMRYVSNIAVLSLLLGGLLGCSETQTRSAWSSRDAWFHPPVEWSRFQKAQSLPDVDVVEVTPDRMASAEEQLRYVTCAEISNQRAAELTGQPMASGAGGSLFLVRGVYLNRGTGKFMVVFVGRELLVEHGSLGHSAVPMKRQALVVHLPQKPEVVYVSCSMDE